MDSLQPIPQSYEETILRQKMPRWPACDQPKAWAQYRDALPKCLPWFYDVEAGVCLTTLNKKHPLYSEKRYITGLLINKSPAVNSYIDAEVIITSLYDPGKAGEPTSVSRSKAAGPTCTDRRLVGCLIGHDATVETTSQAFFPCPMPENQNCWVLGFYIITDVWDALTEGGLVTMVRVERWRLEEKAWFASSDSSHDPPPLSQRDFVTKAPDETCQTCGHISPRMFEEYFLCRNENCKDHWKSDGEVKEGVLTYTKAYLQQREPRSSDGFKPYGGYKGNDDDFPNFAPIAQEWWQQKYKAFESTSLTKEDFEDRMKVLNKGFWCPSCGMMNRRLKWNVWECANTTCDFTLEGHPMIMTADELTAFNKIKTPNWSEMSCHQGSEDTTDYTRHNFDLHHGCGVTVIVPKAGTNAKAQGSDWLLNRFQHLAKTGEIDLRKQFVKAKNLGTTSNHFIHNYGKSYKLEIDISQTTPFENAPEELRVARDTANLLCRQYQSRPGEEDFNQCYVAAYFTDNKMNYHDDGEKGIASAIATWTLGGEGRMLIAVKRKQFHGSTYNNEFMKEEDLLLPGVVDRETRKELKEARDAKIAANPDDAEACKDAQSEYEDGFKALWKQKLEAHDEKNKEKRNKGKKEGKEKPSKPDRNFLLSIPLTHGSIVVMHGENMQKYYEHEVSVETPLRFALTFRHVTEENDHQKTLTRKGEHLHTPDISYLQKFFDEQVGKAHVGPSGTEQRGSAKEEEGKWEGEEEEEIESQAGPSGTKRRQTPEEEGEEQSESQVGPSPLKKRKTAKGKRKIK